MESSGLQGASRTTGGIFRGKAQGNVFNIGDAKEVIEVHSPKTGKLKVFKAGQDPSSQKPQMTVNVKVGAKLAPVLNELAKRFSPIKNKNKRVFVYEEGNWSVKGRFDMALEIDDPVTWANEAGEYCLFVALVNFVLFF
ncbi:hypothetical protein F5887DRAFT_893932 [Amanita rubescens]|nr:hypothetical protein F5887DRAFT_893932 [Amanita rubescens]